MGIKKTAQQGKQKLDDLKALMKAAMDLIESGKKTIEQGEEMISRGRETLRKLKDLIGK